MKKSFTLIELLIVLLIISLIIGVVTPLGGNLFKSVNEFINKKKKKELFLKAKYFSFLKEESNKSLKINRYGIDEKSIFSN